jgi:hypothetical protein
MEAHSGRRTGENPENKTVDHVHAQRRQFIVLARLSKPLAVRQRVRCSQPTVFVCVVTMALVHCYQFDGFSALAIHSTTFLEEVCDSAFVNMI